MVTTKRFLLLLQIPGQLMSSARDQLTVSPAFWRDLRERLAPRNLPSAQSRASIIPRVFSHPTAAALTGRLFSHLRERLSSVIAEASWTSATRGGFNDNHKVKLVIDTRGSWGVLLWIGLVGSRQWTQRFKGPVCKIGLDFYFFL